MTAPLLEQPADTSTTPEERAVAALATFLAEASLVGAVALPPYLFAQLLRLGFRRSALKAALAIALRGPLFRRPRGPRVAGTVAVEIADEEPLMRARYIVNAARRITDDLDTTLPDKVGPDGLLQSPPTETDRLEGAVRREQTYFDQHVDAQRHRRVAAEKLDEAFIRSAWLVWTLNPNLNNTPGCVWANGQVFSREDPLVFSDDKTPPKPQWPGAVHPRCGCRGVPLSWSAGAARTVTV